MSSTVLEPQSSRDWRVRPLGAKGFGHRRCVQLLLGVIGLGAALRFSTLGLQSFWYDEAVTVHRVLHPGLWDTLRIIPSSESNPPIYYGLAWGWTRLFGHSEFGVRSLSALAGTVTIPLVWLATRRLAGAGAALAAASLAAVNPFLIWYSQDARPYALVVLFAAAGFYWFIRALSERGEKPVAWWSAFGALAIATHYFAVFLVVPEAVWLLYSRRDRASVYALAPLGLVGAALLPLALHQSANGYTHWINELPFATRLVAIPERFLAGETGFQEHPLLVGAALAALAIAALSLRLAQDQRKAVALPAGLGLVTVALPVVLALFGEDYVWPRNLIVAIIPLAIAGGILVASPTQQAIGQGLAIVAVVVSVAAVCAVDLRRRLQRADWRDAAAAARSADERAIVVPFIGDEPMMYYANAQRLPPAGASVAEVDYIGWPVSGHRQPQPPAAFRLISHSRAETLTVLRYLAPKSVRVTPALGRHGLGGLVERVLVAPH